MNLLENFQDDLFQDPDLDRLKPIKGVEDEVNKY